VFGTGDGSLKKAIAYPIIPKSATTYKHRFSESLNYPVLHLTITLISEWEVKGEQV
jgi:hypothetical protein